MNEENTTSRYVLDIAVGGKLMWIGIKIKNEISRQGDKMTISDDRFVT